MEQEKLKVRHIINDKGDAVLNQFKITTKKANYFQSYESVVCKYDRKKRNLILSTDWDRSNTTRKYLYRFFRMFGFYEYSKRAKVLKAIKNKEIILKNVVSLNIV